VKEFVAGILVCLLVVAAIPAFAEGFLDIYAGPSFTDTANITVNSDTNSASRKIGFSNELTNGIRGGYWFAKLPWFGVAGDFSIQHARSASAKFDLSPICAMVLFRVPIAADEEIPQGRVQPYAGIGPSISLYTYGAVDSGPPLNHTNSWDPALGFQAPAGIAVQLAQHLALFIEYRYTFFDVRIRDSGSIFSSTDTKKIRASLSGHNLLLGVSFRF
jgi:opacity protein-like surface antigen